MKRNRILHLADLHLGDDHAYLGPRAPERRREADAVLARIVEEMLSPASAVGGVIIAGDLFESHEPPAALVQEVLALLRRVSGAGIRVLTVPGNHDEYSYPSSVYRARAGDWPDVLVTTPSPAKVAAWNLEGLEVDLYAMAYVAGRSRPPYEEFEVAPGPARKVAVFHGSLDVPWEDRSLPLSSERLGRLDLDYVALGHIHRPAESRSQGTLFCYPGRIEGGGYDDPGGAGLVEVDLTASPARIDRRPFPGRPIGELSLGLSGYEGAEELEARIVAEADPARILRLRLEGVPGFVFDAAELERRLASRFYHLEVQSTAQGLDDAAFQLLRSERTIRGLFARIAAREIDAAPDEGERELRRAALRLGLAAFEREDQE